MTNVPDLNMFAVCVPGFEKLLFAEAREKGFPSARYEKGGVTLKGPIEEVWRANLVLRGASKILIRLGSFPVFHLAQLDKRARKFPWGEFLPKGGTIRVETTSIKSKIYHEKAASERIEKALFDQMDLSADPQSDLILKVRLFENLCTFSLDTSGDPLHKRGHKQALNKAPLRETLAALCLKHCGFAGTEPVVDPLCGSGTFILEAGEIATHRAPGQSRPFAFERLPGFDPEKWQDLKQAHPAQQTDHRFYGFDRDAGAIERARKNGTHAGLSEPCSFEQMSLGQVRAPNDGPVGLVITNPPYGVRIGDRKKLFSLYQSFGHQMKTHFQGWRIAVLAHSPELVKATNLPFKRQPLSFSHGGIAVRLYQTDPL